MEKYNMQESMKFFSERCLVLIFMVGVGTVQAQQGWLAGVGPSIEIDQGLFGVNTRLFYGINESICFGPEVAFFPYKGIDDEFELTVVDLNFNAHYIFEVSEKLGLYPLTGINYTIEKERLIRTPEDSEKENEFGWNYGFGAHYNLGDFFVFTEFKGITGSLNDEFMTVGVIFSWTGGNRKTMSE